MTKDRRFRLPWTKKNQEGSPNFEIYNIKRSPEEKEQAPDSLKLKNLLDQKKEQAEDIYPFHQNRSDDYEARTIRGRQFDGFFSVDEASFFNGEGLIIYIVLPDGFKRMQIRQTEIEKEVPDIFKDVSDREEKLQKLNDLLKEAWKIASR
jgi:hypothetical protein